jgi:hypothetical protein
MKARTTEKAITLREIKELVQAFYDRHLNEELAGYALKLCDTLGRKRILDISRGRKEIWATAIVYVITRLNRCKSEKVKGVPISFSGGH